MKDAYTFKVWTEITVTKDDVIEDLKEDGFFDEEVTLTDDDEKEYTDIITNEEAVENYEPTYEDYENLAHKWWKEDQCEYYGPDPI